MLCLPMLKLLSADTWLAFWASFQCKDHLSMYGISILKITQSWEYLIFNVGIPILVRWHLYTEMALWWITLVYLYFLPIYQWTDSISLNDLWDLVIWQYSMLNTNYTSTHPTYKHLFEVSFHAALIQDAGYKWDSNTSGRAQAGRVI